MLQVALYCCCCSYLLSHCQWQQQNRQKRRRRRWSRKRRQRQLVSCLHCLQNVAVGCLYLFLAATNLGEPRRIVSMAIGTTSFAMYSLCTGSCMLCVCACNVTHQGGTEKSLYCVFFLNIFVTLLTLIDVATVEYATFK